MAYAENTSVSPERSRAEIETLLKRYGAEGFGYMANAKCAQVMFTCNGRTIRFVINMPTANEIPTPKRARWNWPTDAQKSEFIDRESRRRWRALVLVVKSKLEAVESKISTFDDEFMAHVVLENGQTLAEYLRPQWDRIASREAMPLMLGAGS